MNNFNDQDFANSAKETVELFFKGFSYPSKSMFTENEIDHIIDVVSSIYMTQHEYRIGGGFVHAILNNNLSDAFSRADSTMLKAMRIVVYAKNYGLVKKY